MNMLKRTLAMMLVLCMLFTMAPITAFAEDTTDPAGTASPAADGDLGDNITNKEVLKTSETPKIDESKDNETKDDVTQDDVTKDDVTKDDVTKDDVTKDDVTKDDVTKDDVTKDDVTKDDVTKDDVTKDDVTKDDETKDDETKDDVTKDDVTKDDVTKDDVTKDDETKDDVTKDDVTKDDVTEDDEDEEVTDPTEDPYGINLTAEVEVNVASSEGVYTSTVERPSEFMRVFHLDVGRRHFTVDEVKSVIDLLAANYYTHMELAIGNDGLRLLLNDMSITVNGTTYSSANVADGIKAGNAAYSHAGEWSQSEMDSILSYAEEKNIEIIPLVNSPGHMDSILDAMEHCGINGSYNGSARTVDITNADAVAFTQALVGKYMDYFDAKGCTYFNIGADEYANDIYGTGSMGWGHLMQEGLYDEFIEYVNELVAMAAARGLRPIAFNDGIYFEENTSYGTFDTRLVVAAWTGGWGGFDVARTSFLAGKNHLILNTNERWYYVVGRDSGTYNYSGALSEASNEKVTVVTDHESGVSPIGAMQCIWYDTPSVSYTSSEVTRIETLIKTMAESNPDYFKAPEIPDVTIRDENTGISASAPGLTDLSVTKIEDAANVPSIEGADDIRAYTVEATVAGAPYTGEIELSIPVPATWTRAYGGVMASASGEQVLNITGKLENGMFTFTAPHLSNVVTYTSDYDEVINLEVGKTHEIVIKNVNYNGDYTTDPTGIATVVAKHEETEGTGSGAPVTSVTDGDSYYIINSDNNYLSATASWVDTIDDAVAWTVEKDGKGYVSLKHNGAYLAFDEDINRWTTTTNEYDDRIEWLTYDPEESKWFAMTSYSLLTLTEASGSVAINQSTITFTGIAPGTTYATVGDTTYKIVVTGKVDITITYQTVDENGNATVIRTEPVTVADNATTYTVSGFSQDNKFYQVSSPTLDLELPGITEYTVIVIETDEDLSQVPPVQVEWWITNKKIVPNDNTLSDGTMESGAHYTSITATEAYGEAGIALTDQIPLDIKSRDNYEYWRWKATRLANGNHQTGDSGSDKTGDGDDFHYVRYYNGQWSFSYDRTDWQAINEDDQLVAYYLQKVDITNEIDLHFKDWGTNPGEQDGNDQGHVALSVAVVYPDGTLAPAENSIYSNSTTIFNYWTDRNIGIIAPENNSTFTVSKITVTNGTASGGYYSWDGQTTINWEKETNEAGSEWFKERTVWAADPQEAGEGDTNDTSTPLVHGILDDVKWQSRDSAILVLVYLETVHYENNLIVKWVDDNAQGSLIHQFEVNVSSENEATTFYNELKQNAELPDSATGGSFTLDDDAYVVNSSGFNQTFNKDITVIPNVAAQYKSGLYKYVGADLSADGMTMTLHYNVDPEKLAPMYVIDFGLPMTFPISDLVNNPDDLQSAEIIGQPKYGTAVQMDGNITYTPTRVLQEIDVLPIRVTFKNSEIETVRVGIAPATTVYYEESFLTYDSSWSCPINNTTREQTREILSDQGPSAGRLKNNYGYDPVYANDINGSSGTSFYTSTNGATASFTFTGTGFALYANCNDGTGYVTLTREGSTKKMYMMDTGLNYEELNVDMPGAIERPTDWFYNIPIITEKNLPYGEYTVTIRKTNNDRQELQIDGIRIYNTVQDSSIFTIDLEDNPVFYELRDVVLNALGVQGATSSQVYAALPDDTSAVVTHDSINYASAGEQNAIQALLENGPKNEIYLFKDQTLTFKIKTNRVVQIGLKAPNGATTYKFAGDNTDRAMDSSVDMFYDVLDKATEENREEKLISVTNTGNNILAITDLKVCDDPGFSFAPLNEADIAAILHEEIEPEAPTFTMVELKGTDVFIDGTVFDYTGEAIEPAVTVNVDGTQLVEGRDYSVTYTNNVQPGTATVTIRGIATASETLGYTGEVSIDYTINAPAEPEVPEETTKPTKPGKPEKPDNGNKPGNNKPTDSTNPTKPEKPDNGNKPGNDKPTDSTKPGNGNNNSGKPSADKNEKQKDAKLKVTFINLVGKKVGSATLTKTGTANQRCVFSLSEIFAQAPARRLVMWLMPVMVPYGSTSSIIIPVI